MLTKFEDYQGNEIKLADDVWNGHIKEDHPLITKEIIANVLKSPSLVCKSQHKHMDNNSLYYQGPWLNENDKSRFFRVVVKTCSDGNWISSAHIRSSITCGEILFKEGTE